MQTDELLPGDVILLGECLYSLKVVFILMDYGPVKRIKIPKPPFLPIYCSSVAHVLSMKELVEIWEADACVSQR